MPVVHTPTNVTDIGYTVQSDVTALTSGRAITLGRFVTATVTIGLFEHRPNGEVFATVSALSELLKNNRYGIEARQAADKAADLGVHLKQGTIAGYFAGTNKSRPSEKTMKALSEVLSIPLEKIREAAGVPVGESAEFTERVPRAGGKFVVVDTTVLNDGLTPIDITCAGPIRNTLTTEGQRQYSTVDEQYNIQGNPECNDMLQPGFDAPMKFVYEVPAAAVPVAFGFSDAANVGDKPTYIELISE